MLKTLPVFGKLTSLMLAGILAFAAVGVTPQPAEAYRRGGAGIGLGIAAGIIAGAAIGSYAYGAPPYYRYSRNYAYDNGCYSGPRQCRREGGYCDYNRFGDYVCRGGTVRCYRPTVCD